MHLCKSHRWASVELQRNATKETNDEEGGVPWNEWALYVEILFSLRLEGLLSHMHATTYYPISLSLLEPLHVFQTIKWDASHLHRLCHYSHLLLSVATFSESKYDQKAKTISETITHFEMMTATMLSWVSFFLFLCLFRSFIGNLHHRTIHSKQNDGTLSLPVIGNESPNESDSIFRLFSSHNNTGKKNNIITTTKQSNKSYSVIRWNLHPTTSQAAEEYLESPDHGQFHLDYSVHNVRFSSFFWRSIILHFIHFLLTLLLTSAPFCSNHLTTFKLWPLVASDKGVDPSKAYHSMLTSEIRQR
jgi:hypothetical protein